MAGILVNFPEKLEGLIGQKKRRPVGAVAGGLTGGAAGTAIGLTRPKTLQDLARIVKQYAGGMGASTATGRIGGVIGKRVIPIALLTAAMGSLAGSKLQDVTGK